MDQVLVFDKNEYEKMMRLIGHEECDSEKETDKNDYVTAWTFGKSEDDYNYVIRSSIE